MARPARPPPDAQRVPMYHSPDGSAYLSGEALTVVDILVADLTIDGAYAQLPADMRRERDEELDDLLPWRPRAAVLRELHRQRAGEFVAHRPCRTCTEGLVPELLTLVEHPSGSARTVTLLDAVVDLAGSMFEVAAGKRSLAAIVDQYCDYAAARRICATQGCAGASTIGGTAPRGGDVPAFAMTVLGMLAAWAYEAGMARDTEPAITEAWRRRCTRTLGLADQRGAASRRAGRRRRTGPARGRRRDPGPQRWAGCDWGAMARTRGEMPTLSELRVEQGVSEEAMALSVLSVANWLAAESSRALTG